MVPFTMPTSLAASILVSACFLQAVTASSFNGLPRPKDFPDAPTTAYGKLPTVYITRNQPADCDWYGFANVNYPADVGLQCMAYIYKTKIVDKANEVRLEPYTYYGCSWYDRMYSDNVCFDKVWDSDYCVVGCFYLGNSSLPLPPVTALPPPAPPAAPGNSAPGDSAPGNTAPRVSLGSGVLQPSSVIVLCGGVIFAAVGLFNRW